MLFIPNTFDKEKPLDLNDEQFLSLQIKYKQLFEKMVISQLDFSSIEEKLKEHHYPIVNDKDYNFYRKYSTLGSDYIYFRNNIHLERLTEEEIKKLISGNINIDFLKNTYERVLYEDGDITFLGEPSDSTRVPSKSIILELAIDFPEIQDLESALLIDDIVEDYKNDCNQIYGNEVAKILGITSQDVVGSYYPAIPDIFLSSNIENIPNKKKA